MGPDHVAHEKGLGAEYRNYLADVTGGETLEQLREKLIDIEQYYNKIFIITTDHGHTETGATGAREDWTKDNWQSGGPPVDSGNRNMHLEEFGALVELIDRSLDERRFHQLLRRDASDTSQADLAIAFNGPMAHVYVRARRGTDGTRLGWDRTPCQYDRDLVANGIAAALGGVRSSFGTSPDLNAAAQDFGPGRPLRSLTAAVDFVLVRKGDEYVVRQPGPIANGTPTPTPSPIVTPEESDCGSNSPLTSSVREFSLDEFFASTNLGPYVNPKERVHQLNHAARAGDVVVVFRSRTEDPPTLRHVSSSNIPSWHGSLNRSDSIVPFVASPTRVETWIWRSRSFS